MSGDRQVSADWFDNVDAVDGEPLERVIATPGQAAELMREAYFRCALRSLSRRSSQSDGVPGARQDAEPARSAWRPWRLAIAALLCLGAGMWLLLALLPDRNLPTLNGRHLADGQQLEADAAPLSLRWRDDTRIELAAGGALRIGSAAERRIQLQRGELQVDIPQRSGAPSLTIDAGGCFAAATAGSVFVCQRTPAAVWLSVARGAVALRRDSDLFQATIPAGGACVLPRHGQPHVDVQAVASRLLRDADQPASVVTAGQSPGDGVRLSSEPGICGGTAARLIGTFAGDPPVDMVGEVRHWLLLDFTTSPAVWNLSGSDGLEFWLRGPDDAGSKLWVEVICPDDGPASGDEEQTHFTTIVPRVVPGWQLIRLPWSAFALREWPARPPGTPLRLDRIWNCKFMLLGVKHPDFAVDRLSVWAAPY